MNARGIRSCWRQTAGGGMLSASALLGGCAASGTLNQGARLAPEDFRAPSASAEVAAGEAPEAAGGVVAPFVAAINQPAPADANHADMSSVAADAARGSDVRVIVGPPGGGGGAGVAALASASANETPDAPQPDAQEVAAGQDVAASSATGKAGAGAPADDDAVSVDALVGQINGRPLFASEFLAPMDARLRAEAARLPPREWLDFARQEIARQLRSRVVNDLLLAEARASLTPEQRQGLLFFLENFRESLVSQSAGSREVAERVIQEQEGRTLDDKAREMLDQELLRMQLRRALADSAQVSWREVELEYERRKGEFNPPPTITLRMIRAPAHDAERVARIASALASGESFEAIARRESDWNAEGGGLYPREGNFRLDAPSLAEATIFGPQPLNDAARTLTQGLWTGPIEFNGSSHWLYLERVERTQVSLFEAQLELLDRLRAQRLQEAERRYLEELIGRGSLTDIQRMESRLLQFAIERYLLEGRS